MFELRAVAVIVALMWIARLDTSPGGFLIVIAGAFLAMFFEAIKDEAFLR